MLSLCLFIVYIHSNSNYMKMSECVLRKLDNHRDIYVLHRSVLDWLNMLIVLSLSGMLLGSYGDSFWLTGLSAHNAN